MTIRQRLERVRHRMLLVALAGWIVFGAGVIGGGSEGEILALAVGGFLVFLTGVLLLLFGIRCPACGEGLGDALAWPPSLLRIPARIRYCPFCRADFDAAEPGAFSKDS